MSSSDLESPPSTALAGPTCDVLIVGGGPAGLAVALELRHLGSLPVLVVERTSYDTVRIGETLSPGARELLVHLGVPGDLAAAGHLPAYGTSAAWGGPALATRDYMMTPFGTGWHLDRRRFDAQLAGVAGRDGAAVWCGSRLRHLVAEGAGFAAFVEREGRVHEVRPRFVVDATGKSGLIARRFGADRRSLDHQVAIAGTFRFLDEPPAETLTLVEACEFGWWYSARIPGREVAAVLITDADLARTHHLASEQRWRAAVERLPHTAARLAGGQLIRPPRALGAQSACLVRTAGEHWLAVGDAAGSHDPLSASGIVRALDSGIHAARAIHATLVGGRASALPEYERRQSLAFDRYCDTRDGYYQMERRWPGAPFWRRRQRRVTIDPLGCLGPDPKRPRGYRPPRLPADLRHLDADLLVSVASPPRLAHEVVAGYLAQAPRPARDLDVILGLQWLVARGALEQRPAGQVNESIDVSAERELST